MADESAKVGSSHEAAAHFADKNDFGIPARTAHPGQQEVTDDSMNDRPLGSMMPPNTPDGVRTNGVGAPDSGPGSFSGGDLDPDIIGLDGKGGLSASPVGHGKEQS